jgi:lipopolysaccharide/colanic/teichoic acid biosynthesis glycosyltransferase
VATAAFGRTSGERGASPALWQLRAKDILDYAIAAMLLTVSAPLLLFVAGLVALSLGRPILYRQVRVGQFGREFTMLKFRTMIEADNCRELCPAGLGVDEGPGGIEGTDRRSAVGRWLRRTSLDELPQLWNVLRGEMSLVGPRPERPEYVSFFADEIFGYRDRHRLKTGITGLAQVSGLYGHTSISERAACDNAYIDNFSLLLDGRILLRTVGIVLRRVSEAE